MKKIHVLILLTMCLLSLISCSENEDNMFQTEDQINGIGQAVPIVDIMFNDKRGQDYPFYRNPNGKMIRYSFQTDSITFKIQPINAEAVIKVEWHLTAGIYPCDYYFIDGQLTKVNNTLYYKGLILYKKNIQIKFEHCIYSLYATVTLPSGTYKTPIYIFEI